jgi:hypothetical protein
MTQFDTNRLFDYDLRQKTFTALKAHNIRIDNLVFLQV